MTTAIILISILGVGAFWMYRKGIESAAKDNLEADLGKLKNINKMDQKHDQDTQDLLSKLAAIVTLSSPCLQDFLKAPTVVLLDCEQPTVPYSSGEP